MKRRITRVTTRHGDSGRTSLADGSNVAKTDPIIEAIGSVDELNSFVGTLVIELDDAGEAHDLCVDIQQQLFDLGAHLATLGQTPAPDPAPLEAHIARLNATLPPLREFVLPGGTRAAAAAHVCRSVCRRAERVMWAAGDSGSEPARYLNRLSDLFFVLARCFNAGQDEPQWRGSQGQSSDIAE
ncbi:MAG: cob(I)yrinic acid a,c-diamide adenosyltransferase [Pseudomonadales bacterium]